MTAGGALSGARATRPEREPRKLGLDVGASLGVGVVVVVLLMWVAHGLATGDWNPFNGAPTKRVDWNSAARIAVPGAALIAGIVAAVIAGHGHRTRLDELEATRDANVTDRYTKAIEQLGHDNLSIRIGGIYALERIARDSSNDLPTICRVLEEHIRITAASIRAGGPDPGVLAPADMHACFKTLARLSQLEGSTYDLNRLDVSGIDLRDARLGGAELTSADLARADLTGADLTGALLIGAYLMYANLTDANLNRASLNLVDLTSADLNRANLAGANLTGANLTRAKLTEANLSIVKLTGANLTRADLTDANLIGANLPRADLTDANLTSANLQDADLTDADLTGVHLTDKQRAEGLGW